MIFGRYSLGHFAAMILQGAGLIFWLGLFFLPSDQLASGLAFIQERAWLVLLILLVSAVVIWKLVTVERFSGHSLTWFQDFPFFLFSLVAIVALFNLTLLLGQWTETVPLWQTLARIVIAVVVIIELLAQLLAYLGMLPGRHKIAGLFVPYGRIYHNNEGLTNTIANNYGWPYPKFRLRAGSKKIMLMGDSFIQALQIQPRQHMGVQLETLLNDGVSPPKTEILTLGMPGFGPGLYLSDTRLRHAMIAFQPDELILFFNLGSDFQTVFEPSGYELYHTLENDQVVLPEELHEHRHDLQHLILDGYQPVIDPLKIIQSYYLTPKVWQGLLSNGQPQTPGQTEFDIPSFKGVVLRTKQVNPTHSSVKATDLIATPGRSNFIFKKESSPKAELSLKVALGLLQAAQTIITQEYGATMRLVTIPVFPRAFFRQNHGGDWSSEIGEYDLFRPEQVLQRFAQEHNLPFLPMGQTMHDQRLRTEQIERFYLLGGQGHLTPEGHAYFAQAICRHFYA